MPADEDRRSSQRASWKITAAYSGCLRRPAQPTTAQEIPEAVVSSPAIGDRKAPNDAADRRYDRHARRVS